MISSVICATKYINIGGGSDSSVLLADYQQTRSSSQLSGTPVSGEPTPSSFPHKHQSHIWHTDIHASKKVYTHFKIINT